ncbi:hypothetical protein PC116_g20055 [Phytophthora cactorum]|nr:hypothetical protein PC116_g20055 [Phytophthora cactorum]
MKGGRWSSACHDHVSRAKQREVYQSRVCVWEKYGHNVESE